MDDRFQCDYLDLSKQNASDMLLNCVQNKDKGYDFNCQSNKITNESSNSVFQRGIDQGFNGTEGFTSKIFFTDNGPGKSTVTEGICPDGYTNKNGVCVQVCMGCKYRDNMKSQEFNEADPCFPEGVYNGVTNEGKIKCTCGLNDKYCTDEFVNMYTTDGVLFLDNTIKNNIGIVDAVSKLFYFEQL